MGTYGIDEEEFLDGHINPTINKRTERYGFEDFLRDFEGDVGADTIAKAFNKLARKHKWNDRLVVVRKDEVK